MQGGFVQPGAVRLVHKPAAERGGFRRAILLAALLCTGPACSSFDDLTVAPPPCKPADVPPAPLAQVDEGQSDFVVAVSQYDLGEAPNDAGVTRFSAIGFDLDNTCTGQEGPWSCREPPWANANHADGRDGRDNAMGGLLYKTRQLIGTRFTESVNELIQTGYITTLIRVRGYNGLQNDSTVELALYGATRKFLPTDPSQPSDSPVPPNWDGNDVWNVYRMWTRSDLPGDPAYVDTAAYVNDGILVAHWPTLLVGVGYNLSNAKMAASLVRNGDGWSLVDATVAGRLPIEEIFALGPRCKDAPDYCQLKELMCSFPDINFQADDDGSHPCNAFSLAWQFQADPAQMGGVDPRNIEQLCPPDTSPAGETCDNATCPRAQ